MVFGDWKRNIAANVTSMIEAGETCQRNMFSEINIAMKSNTNITYRVWWCDAMNKDGRRAETSKFAAWSGCSSNNEICFGALSLSILLVIHPTISLRQSPSCIRERSVSAVNKDMYTWVSSAYKLWSNLWLWIRELSGVLYKVNSSRPRTEPCRMPQNAGAASEN